MPRCVHKRHIDKNEKRATKKQENARNSNDDGEEVQADVEDGETFRKEISVWRLSK